RMEKSLQHLSLPDPLQRLVESYIEKKVGKKWDDPVTLERIRTAITTQKRQYWREGSKREIQYRTGYSVLAYLAYQMPVFFGQFQHLLFLLASEGLLPEEMTVLDVGTGPGIIPLAIADFYRRLGHGSVTVHALESSDEHREAFQFLVPAYTGTVPGVHVEPLIRGDLSSVDDSRLPHRIDLIVFSNVLNEIPVSTGERARILHQYAPLLAENGTVVLTEPADLANSTELRRVSLATVSSGEYTLYAPCTFLWGRHCRPERCWSFAFYGEIAPPLLMEALGRSPEGYRFLNTDMKMSYALLRKDGRTRCPHRIPAGSRFLPLSQLPRHVGKVVNVVAAVMSEDIGDRDHHVHLVCDGTAEKPVYVILPRYQAGKNTRDLLEARYGDLREFREVLVRYNRTHDSYNLLLTARSRVLPFTLPEGGRKKQNY
ncbi:MAG: hypothetical protein LUQ17_03405, partial [Methanomicrobiales archaeon]|nr:hypothetical protein [Methanomicrobiales archaeon]